MRWKLLFYMILLSLCYGYSRAQVFDSSLIIAASAVRNSPFTADFLADSFSKAGDSIQASACLLRMDPYYLVFQNISPTKLDTFFSGYKITATAKNEYRKKFEKVFHTPRNENYLKFEEMFREDQQARSNLDGSDDSVLYAFFEQKMEQTDAVHFDYLYKYVTEHGWPKPADGGLYAGFLALHDGTDGHMLYYLRFMKKAVLAGQAESNMYHSVLNRAIHPPFLQLAKNYKYVRFDISYVLKSQPPTTAQMDVMKKTVKEHKPVKYIYFSYKSKNEKDYEIFSNKQLIKTGHADAKQGWDTDPYWLAWDIMGLLENYQDDLLLSNFRPFYQFDYEGSLSSQKKLFMYLLY